MGPIHAPRSRRTFLKALASNPSISPALREKFIKHKNEEIQWAFVRNPKLTEEEVLRLVEDENLHYSLSCVKMRLSKEILDVLIESSQESSLMRQKLSWRSDLDESHFKILLQDDDRDNLKGLAENKNIPNKLLASLMNHEDSEVKKTAAREYVKRKRNDQNLLLKLAKEDVEDQENSKLRVIAQYVTKPSDELLKILINSKNEEVVRHLVFNENRPIKTLEYLRDNYPNEGIKYLSDIRIRWESEERPKLPEYLKVLKSKFGFGTYLPDFNEGDCVGGTKAENDLPNMRIFKKFEAGYKLRINVVGFPKALRLEF